MQLIAVYIVLHLTAAAQSPEPFTVFEPLQELLFGDLIYFFLVPFTKYTKAQQYKYNKIKRANLFDS